MSLDAIQSHVWDNLPMVNRTIVGRRAVRRIVSRAVANWPSVVLQQCDAQQTDVVAYHYTKSVLRQARQEYGMGILAMLVLGALVQEIVKLLVAWWLDSRENREAMMAASTEAKAP